MVDKSYHDVKVPGLGESVVQATVIRWMKKVGDPVKMDETLVELETEKVTLDVAAPVAGVLSDIAAAVGQVIGVGGLLGRINQDPAAAATTTATTDTKPAATSPEPAVASPEPASEFTKLSPAVAKLVETHNLDPAKISVTGKDGRLSKADVMAAVDKNKTAAPSEAIFPPASEKSPSLREGLEERVRMTRLRQKIAERLKVAQNTAAILTTFNEADMSAVNALRAHYKQTFEEKYGIKLGFMSFFVKACAMALHEFPAVNAEIDGEDIIYKNYYDIGVAVSAPQGLVVPVVRNVDQLSFADIEKDIAALSQKTRDGKLTLAELTGGTFTISNGGVFGSLMSTPILNPPQSAILGMHKIQERPVVIEGTIQIRPMMYLALSYDHRMVDGREAVTFLVRVKDLIENPDRLLLEV
jgi:2-oxoglutarate dehydrogenase E2 component (dihydrolipoamide succinyltransferase)